jgi:hypothetical protein
MQPRTRLLAAFSAALIIGMTFPYAELAWKCRESSSRSEACVWGKAYFPLARWVEPLIVTPIVFLVIVLGFRLLDRRRSGPTV